MVYMSFCFPMVSFDGTRPRDTLKANGHRAVHRVSVCSFCRYDCGGGDGAGDGADR